MIKELKKFQIRTTPFQATKNWDLDNIFNQNVLLLEQTASDGSNIALAIEFIDYGDGSSNPTTGSTCDVALQQQDSDLVGFREGINLTGPFYPDTEPQNADGTYKRVVYSQINTAFYNTFRNPTEILGVENIDFELSKTKRRITNTIKLFEIPQLVFGDKILPGSVQLLDFSQDNDYTITDDGNENLIIGNNLFSKVQTVGMFGNFFTSGSDGACNGYFSFGTGSAPVICGFGVSLTGSSYAISGYFDGMISSSIGSPAAVGDITWRGVFQLYYVNDIANRFYFYGFDTNNQFPVRSVITGHEVCNEYLQFNCVNGTPTWNFFILTDSGVAVYSAVKTGDNSPLGLYTADGGTNVPIPNLNTSSILLVPSNITIITDPTPETASLLLQDFCGAI